MNHFECTGTHKQIGFAMGSALWEHKTQLLQQVPFAITRERIEYAAACVPVYQAYYPEILEELEGLASGQRCDVSMLQAVLFSTYAIPPACYCSCFAAASDREVVFGRNSDFLTALEASNTNVIYRPTDGAYSFTGNTTSFLQMEDGVNEYGLAVGLTSVYPAVRKPGFNAGLLTRYFLEKCRTVPEALAALERLPVGSAQTLTLADPAGNMAVAECCAEKTEVILPAGRERPFVCATNAFHSAAMQQYLVPQEDDWFAEPRYQTMRKALEGPAELPLRLFAEKLLSGGCGLLCQYDRSTGRDTVWSVIYDLGQRRVYRSEENPARAGYRQDTRFSF